jgi:ribosomal protein S18 acetylase RimI-like enzyme
VIRAATAADEAAVVGLWQDCGLTRPWNDPHADFRLALASGAACVLLAGDGDDLLGAAMVGFDGHRGWIYYLAVAERARRGGIGGALMHAAKAWLRGRDCPKLLLMVREDNAAALGFYRSLGLEPQPVVTLGRFLEDSE